MKVRNSSPWLVIERVVPWLVLLILLFYTDAKFFGHPYGFRWNGTGTVVHVFDQQPEPTLKEGDRVVRIGDISWEEFSADLLNTFFAGSEPGDIVPIVVDRDGQLVEIDWTYPPALTGEEFLDQLISEWFFAYFFWLAGLLTVLVIRPRDERWLLMALFNFLTAIWLIAGSGASAFHTWGSALVLRMAVLLCLPVYLHLHWLFPQPLGKIPPVVVRLMYAAALLLVIAQALQLLPRDFYLLAFLVAVVGSLILLGIHVLRQPAARRDLRLAFMAATLAFMLAAIWRLFYGLNRIPIWLGSAGLLGFPLLPLAYLYSAFRHRLGGLEMRANRFFSTYLFVVLLGIVELPLIVILSQFFPVSDEGSVISLLAAVCTAVAFIWAYPVFERFIDERIVGIPLPSKRLLETFSTQITTSISSPDLVGVLHGKVLPSLLIRQFAFLHYDQGALNAFYTMGLKEEEDSLPTIEDIPDLVARAGTYLAPDTHGDLRYSWARLILPLKLGNQLIGFWLLGRRDPDDFYSQQEIPTLGSLANLTAVALSNILQTERLTSIYQANISRYEQERVRLARDLHDSILNELAALPIRSDAPVVSAAFQQAYDGVAERLREIVYDLRPPMLVFGLKLALEAYAANLRERNPESMEILVDIQGEGEQRYPLVVENNLYRIVQEACENSLRYAHAAKLSISGRLSEKQIELRVVDDGIGLDPDTSLKFDDLVTHRHFGLAGMHERASVIGAELMIISRAGEGTQIQVSWKSKESI